MPIQITFFWDSSVHVLTLKLRLQVLARFSDWEVKQRHKGICHFEIPKEANQIRSENEKLKSFESKKIYNVQAWMILNSQYIILWIKMMVNLFQDENFKKIGGTVYATVGESYLPLRLFCLCVYLMSSLVCHRFRRQWDFIVFVWIQRTEMLSLLKAVRARYPVATGISIDLSASFLCFT